MIRLAIAEDHQSLIDGIKLLLEYEDAISIVGTANDGEALLEIVEKKQPNVVLTDIRMPKMDGIEATKQIKKKHPKINILAFTMFEQTEAIQQMIEAGASGYILKNSSLEEVHNAILAVAKGEKYFDANINTNVINAQSSNKTKGVLTKRQTEILQLIGQGKTSREIADLLFIGVHTVDTHRKNMVRILGLQGKGELMRFALTITLSQNQDVSIKIDVFKTESDSTKKSTTIKEKTYNYIYKTERKGSWQTTFGFNFIHLRNNDTYFSKTVDSTFVIAEGTNQNKYDFYPTIMFTWYANNSDTINFGLSGGLGYDLEKSVSVFVGGSIIYNQNITITAGLAFHNQQRLNSAYQEGDLIKENLSFEQLHEDYIRLNPFLSIAFRLDKSPFN